MAEISCFRLADRWLTRDGARAWGESLAVVGLFDCTASADRMRPIPTIEISEKPSYGLQMGLECFLNSFGLVRSFHEKIRRTSVFVLCPNAEPYSVLT